MPAENPRADELRASAKRLAPALLLVAFVIQAGIAAVRDSVTVDEVAHVAVGVTMWRTGDFALDPINPPLSRSLLALPALPLDPKLEAKPKLDEWQLGLVLMREDTDRYQEIHVAARMATIAFALLLGVLLFRLSSELHGPSAAIVALALYVFSPTVLAHGHLATVDLAAALGVFAVVFASIRYLESPSRVRAAALGAVLGVAIVLKLSSASAGAIVIGVLVVGALGRESRLGHLTADLVVVAAGAWLVVCASYGFQGFGARFDGIGFAPNGTFARLAAAVPALRLPFPSAFLEGLDLLATGNLDGSRTFYLAGELSTRGWWSYHPIAFALKTPPAFIIAAILGVAIALFGRARPRGERLAALAAALVIGTTSALNPLNVGVRHLLPAEPLLCLLAAPLLAGGGRGLHLRRLAMIAVVASQVGAAVGAAPQYLTYFNALAGGSSRGHRWLVDSNIDWGQDLVRLREYLDRRGLDSIALAYFGTVHPAVYGIRFEPVTRATHGVVVVSPTLLAGVPSTMWQASARWGRSERGEYAWLGDVPVADRVGSLFVYELP